MTSCQFCRQCTCSVRNTKPRSYGWEPHYVYERPESPTSSVPSLSTCGSSSTASSPAPSFSPSLHSTRAQYYGSKPVKQHQSNGYFEAQKKHTTDSHHPTVDDSSVHQDATAESKPRASISAFEPRIRTHTLNGNFIRHPETVGCIMSSSPRHLIIKLIISRMKRISLIITCNGRDPIPLSPCNRSPKSSRPTGKLVPSCPPSSTDAPPPTITYRRSRSILHMIHAIRWWKRQLSGPFDEMTLRLSRNPVQVSPQKIRLGLRKHQDLLVTSFINSACSRREQESGLDFNSTFLSAFSYVL
ncbi:hypothetical protein F5890DRAFT_1481292 [Lentinula detonsa]|uniref:Uncharacterized protein n=1 Tax=Lentinula detonsa TaxID=2804962 RepID=A0AA38QAU1_9AGAR|nr:hypothetical protein F5890DRAFT_1481292 [Lentinula detonsa]